MNRSIFRFFSNLSKRYDFLKINSLRQKGLLLTNLPSELLESNTPLNINVTNDCIHIMRSRLGNPFGKALVLIDQISPNFDFKFEDSNNLDTNSTTKTYKNLNITNNSSLKVIYNSIIDNLPKESNVYLCDGHEVSCYVEQCERLLTLPNDLRRLAKPELLHRIVTITGVPRSYGRSELSLTIQNHTNVHVKPQNIVFRFKDNGEQDSLAWVLCDSFKDVNTIISKLQEVPVPRRYQYGNLMGAAFLYSARSSFFLSDSSIDFLTNRTKYQVFTMGWHSDVDESELKTLTDSLKFFPKNIKTFKIKSKDENNNETCAFWEFDRMRNTKKIMTRLQIIKKRWKIPENSAFYAYPRMADVLWKSNNGEPNRDTLFNADIDEPVEY